MATTARFVELQTPYFLGAAWADFHARVLSHVSDGALERSSFGLDVSWCGALAYAFPMRPACLVAHHVNAVHLNAQTVEKFGATQIRSSDRQCSETCHELRNRFPSFYANVSHHTRHCWRVNTTDGRITKDESDARLVLDAKGRVRASIRLLHERQDLESGVPHHAAAQWLGVTTLHSSELRLTKALVAALRALCDRHPALRAIINHHDSDLAVGLQRPAKGSEIDERIQTTHMPTALLLWRRVLSPRHLAARNVKFLWLFSKEIVVHPSVRPTPVHGLVTPPSSHESKSLARAGAAAGPARRNAPRNRRIAHPAYSPPSGGATCSAPRAQLFLYGGTDARRRYGFAHL